MAAVLIADGDRGVREELACVLSGEGYVSEFANNGAEVLDYHIEML